MRILVISRWYPYPPDNGSKLRIYNLIRQLAQRHELTLLTFAPGPVAEEQRLALRAHCRDVQVVTWRPFRPERWRALLGFFAPVPRSVVDTDNAEMRTRVRAAVTAQPFDVGLASEIDSVPYLLPVRGLPRCVDELQVGVIRDRYLTQRQAGRRLRAGLTWWKTGRYVRRFLAQYAGCTVASEQERANILAVAPQARRVVVVPNGVDLAWHPGDFGAPEPDTLIFAGALTYEANFDAMAYFLREIFPQVRAQRPAVRLRITGRTEGVPLAQLPLGPGVELTGYLAEVRPVVARSWASVVPLRIGGGTRLKILEALALGTPVVATSKGAEGLAVTPEQDLLIADTPAEFARQTVRLLADAGLRARLVANGRRLVEQRYSWERSGAQLEALLAEIVAEFTSSLAGHATLQRG